MTLKIKTQQALAGGKLTIRQGANVAVTRLGKSYTGGANITKTLSFNAAGVSDFAPTQPFLNVAKLWRAPYLRSDIPENARTNEQLKASGNLDANGFPQNLTLDPLQDERVEWLFAWTEAGMSAHYGTYEFTYDGGGQAEIVAAGSSLTVVSSVLGKLVYTITAPGTFYIRFNSITPGDHPRNFECVRQDYLTLYNAGEIFNPQYLAEHEETAVIRFMDWMETNQNPHPIRYWSDYPVAAYAHWERVPFSVMIAFANQVGCDPWFCLPHPCATLVAGDVDTDFVTQLATLLKATLDPDLVVYIEYSNEPWNTAFIAHNFLNAQAIAAGWTTPTGSNRHPYCAKINAYMARAAKAVYGAEAKNRLVYVGGSGRGQLFWSVELMSGAEWQVQEPSNWFDPKTVLDAITIAPYFGSSFLTSGSGAEVAPLIARIDAGDTPDQLADYVASRLTALNTPSVEVGQIVAQADEVHANGLKILAYEGGKHVHHSFALSGLTEVDKNKMRDCLGYFSYSTQITPFYDAVWDAWEAYGDGPHMQLADISPTSVFGSWGRRRFFGDNNALQAWLDARNGTPPPWWPDNRRPVPD